MAQGIRAGGPVEKQFPNLTVQIILSLSTLLQFRAPLLYPEAEAVREPLAAGRAELCACHAYLGPVVYSQWGAVHQVGKKYR